MDFIKVPTRAGVSVIRVSLIREIHDILESENEDRAAIYLTPTNPTGFDKTYSTVSASVIFDLLKYITGDQ